MKQMPYLLEQTLGTYKSFKLLLTSLIEDSHA